MSSILMRCRDSLKRHPILRGMIAYAVIWPSGSLIQQTIAGERWGTYDWKKCARFGVYAAFFVAPTLYGWIRISTKIWPQTNLKTGITKAIVEQLSYGPMAMSCFFFAMSLMEGGSLQDAKEEVKAKFWPTYKVAICFWPIFQTINFTLIRERNRVPIISLGSLGWTTFLAYMKQLELEKKQNEEMQADAVVNKA